MLESSRVRHTFVQRDKEKSQTRNFPQLVFFPSSVRAPVVSQHRNAPMRFHGKMADLTLRPLFSQGAKVTSSRPGRRGMSRFYALHRVRKA